MKWLFYSLLIAALGMYATSSGQSVRPYNESHLHLQGVIRTLTTIVRDSTHKPHRHHLDSSVTWYGRGLLPDSSYHFYNDSPAYKLAYVTYYSYANGTLSATREVGATDTGVKLLSTGQAIKSDSNEVTIQHWDKGQRYTFYKHRYDSIGRLVYLLRDPLNLPRHDTYAEELRISYTDKQAVLKWENAAGFFLIETVHITHLEFDRQGNVTKSRHSAMKHPKPGGRAVAADWHRYVVEYRYTYY